MAAIQVFPHSASQAPPEPSYRINLEQTSSRVPPVVHTEGSPGASDDPEATYRRLTEELLKRLRCSAAADFMKGSIFFGARRGSMPSADGPDQMRMTYLMQDFLPFHP